MLIPDVEGTCARGRGAGGSPGTGVSPAFSSHPQFASGDGAQPRGGEFGVMTAGEAKTKQWETVMGWTMSPFVWGRPDPLGSQKVAAFGDRLF